MTSRTSSSQTTLWLSLLTLSLIWGSTYLFVKLSVAQLPPFALTAIRAGVASIALALWFFCTGQSLQPFRHLWKHMAVLGMINGWFPDVLTAVAAQHIDSAQSGILVTTTPLFTVMIAYPALRDEALDWRKLVGVVMGFVGVFFVIGPQYILSASGTLLGSVAMLLTAASYAVGNVYGRWLRSPHAAQLALGQNIFTCLPAALFSAVVDPQWRLDLSVTTVGSVLFLGLITTAAANVLFFGMLRRFPATNISTVSYLKLIWSVFLGWAVLSEQLALTALFGCGLIVAGVWLVNRPIVVQPKS